MDAIVPPFGTRSRGLFAHGHLSSSSSSHKEKIVQRLEDSGGSDEGFDVTEDSDKWKSHRKPDCSPREAAKDEAPQTLGSTRNQKKSGKCAREWEKSHGTKVAGELGEFRKRKEE